MVAEFHLLSWAKPYRLFVCCCFFKDHSGLGGKSLWSRLQEGVSYKQYSIMQELGCFHLSQLKNWKNPLTPNKVLYSSIISPLGLKGWATFFFFSNGRHDDLEHKKKYACPSLGFSFLQSSCLWGPSLQRKFLFSFCTNLLLHRSALFSLHTLVETVTHADGTFFMVQILCHTLLREPQTLRSALALRSPYGAETDENVFLLLSPKCNGYSVSYGQSKEKGERVSLFKFHVSVPKSWTDNPSNPHHLAKTKCKSFLWFNLLARNHCSLTTAPTHTHSPPHSFYIGADVPMCIQLCTLPACLWELLKTAS